MTAKGQAKTDHLTEIVGARVSKFEDEQDAILFLEKGGKTFAVYAEPEDARLEVKELGQE